MTNSTDSKKRGRPSDPNRLVFQQIGLRPAQRAYLRLWRPNPDLPPPDPNSPEDNATAQLGMLIDAAMRFWPDGSNFATAWPRDEKGRFCRSEEPELAAVAPGARGGGGNPL